MSSTDSTISADSGTSTRNSVDADRGDEADADDERAAAVQACDGLRAVTEGTVDAEPLVETSGLAGSRRHPGIVWAHNDSGQDPAIYALGADGSLQATFEIEGVADVDIEDIAVADGGIYLADIGDNDAERDEVAVFRFDEPDPASGDGTIDDVEVLRLRYPVGPRDAEAFAIDPISGDLIIVEKAFGFGLGAGLLSPSPATVFVAPADELRGDGPLELTAAGTVALDELASRATGMAPEDAVFTRLGVEGVATGADIRADGRLIALRTYATVWLFERRDGESVAEALASTPCEAPTVVEEQGEAVAFVEAEGSAFVTVSEGASPAWNITSTMP